MTEIPVCGTGGWTLAMKTKGDLVRQKEIFIVCRSRKYLTGLSPTSSKDQLCLRCVLAYIKVYNLEMLLVN